MKANLFGLATIALVGAFILGVFMCTPAKSQMTIPATELWSQP